MSVNLKTIKETGLIGNLFKRVHYKKLSYLFWYVYNYRTIMNIIIDVTYRCSAKTIGYFNQSGGLPQLHVICILYTCIYIYIYIYI